MIDTKELTKKILRGLSDPVISNEYWLRDALDEALAPLLAELERLRAELNDRELEVQRGLEGMYRVTEARRISDHEREVEDRAMRVWEAAAAAKLSKVATDGSEAYVLALEATEDAIEERDRRRAERKGQSNG